VALKRVSPGPRLLNTLRCRLPKRPVAASETSNGQTGALYISLNGATTAAKKKKKARTSDSSCDRSVARNESRKRDRERIREGMSPSTSRICYSTCTPASRLRPKSGFHLGNEAVPSRSNGSSLGIRPRTDLKSRRVLSDGISATCSLNELDDCCILALGFFRRNGDERESIAPGISAMTLVCSSRRMPENYAIGRFFTALASLSCPRLRLPLFEWTFQTDDSITE